MNASTTRPATWRAPEGRGAFGGFIGPRNLLELVRNAAPWLFDGPRAAAEQALVPAGARLCELAEGKLGWWTILLAADRLAATEAPTPAQRTDYFALCLAAHFASAGTYVPTDVDAKIRHAVWLDQADRDELVRMAGLAAGTAGWDVSAVSARLVELPEGEVVSGHDGERLSVLCGGWMALRGAGLSERAAEFERRIDDELAREARLFDAIAREKGREITTAMLAAALTHNAGDVVQALGSRAARATGIDGSRFTDLARERFERYGGAFGRAAAVYREVMASEGHRHYPLREVKLLRAQRSLLLPVAPFLDEWGAHLARFEAWTPAQRAEVVAGLVGGCARVAGQAGYQRALSGFERAHPRGLAAPDLAGCFTTATRRALAEPLLRRQIEVPRASFEASIAKRVRAALARA